MGQLLDTPRKELISMRNMGGKSISVIEEKLKEKGISLQSQIVVNLKILNLK